MAKAIGATFHKALRTQQGKMDSRAGLMKAVHAAARSQALSDEDRRAIQLAVTGKASLKDMSLSEIGKVLDRLNRNKPLSNAQRPHISKIRALWWSLYWIGEVQDPNETALSKFVARQTGISALRFLDFRKAMPVIEALKAWLERAGVVWTGEAEFAQTYARYPGYTMAHHDRHAVLKVVARKAAACKIVDYFYHNYLIAALGLHPNAYHWSERDLDEAIKLLGKKLRCALNRQGQSEGEGEGRD